MHEGTVCHCCFVDYYDSVSVLMHVIKGLNAPEGDSEAASLAMNWKHKLYHQRTMETIRAPRGEKGLRKLNKNRISTPSVVDAITPAPSAMVSPTRRPTANGRY